LETFNWICHHEADIYKYANIPCGMAFRPIVRCGQSLGVTNAGMMIAVANKWKLTVLGMRAEAAQEAAASRLRAILPQTRESERAGGMGRHGASSLSAAAQCSRRGVTTAPPPVPMVERPFATWFGAVYIRTWQIPPSVGQTPQ